MRNIIALLLLALLALGGWYAHKGGRSSSNDFFSPTLAKPTDPCAGETKTPSFIRRQSCDSTACHGSIESAHESDGIPRNEYRTWFDSDPHADAARILGNEVSQRMIKYLAGESPAPGDYTRIYERCFACHNTTVTAVPDRLIESMAFFDENPAYEGVGCQACHGPASEWENIHYFECWKKLSVERKREKGLWDTRTLAARAELCARCHVGEPGRDVDHDLIAAGHPQMKFEMLGYHTLMPHHWNDSRDQSGHPEFESALWFAGQSASAKAALALLEDRANRASRSAGSWPEFSEYDCFACHHDLDVSSWRRERGFAFSEDRVRLPWGIWHFAVLPELAKGQDEGRDFFEAHQKLKATIESRFSPNPALAQTLAREARNALEEWRALTSDPDAAARLREHLRHRGEDEHVPRTWDEAVQLYLAAYAVLESRKSQNPGGSAPLEPDLETLRKALGFPEGYHSPKNFPAASNGDAGPLLKTLLKNLPDP